MGATNSTTNYSLSQFIGTDKPAWLQDYNGDMAKIDTGIHNAKTAADNAQSTADGAQGDATSALSGIADINTELGTVESVLSTATGNINTINSLIGNGTPTTTDQTIIGAINEINAKVVDKTSLAGKFMMIDHNDQVYALNDGAKTYGQLMAECVTSLKAVVQALTANQFLRVTRVDAFLAAVPFYTPDYVVDTPINIQSSVTAVNLVPDSFDVWTGYWNESSCKLVASTVGGASEGFTDESGVISGTIVRIYYDIYEKLS